MKQFWPLSHEIYPAKVDQLKIFDDQKIQNAFCTSFFVLTPRITFHRTKKWTFHRSSTVKMSKFEKLVRKGPMIWGLRNPSKPVTSCKHADELGFTRPLFLDRLCDGHPDCPKGEDEDGKLAKCKNAGEPTPNGCCRYPIIGALTKGPIKCVYTGKTNDSGWFSNKNWTRTLIGWVLSNLENQL